MISTIPDIYGYVLLVATLIRTGLVFHFYCFNIGFPFFVRIIWHYYFWVFCFHYYYLSKYCNKKIGALRYYYLLLACLSYFLLSCKCLAGFEFKNWPTGSRDLPVGAGLHFLWDVDTYCVRLRKKFTVALCVL